MDIPNAGDVVRHIRTDRLYKVVKATLSKHGDGSWTPSINYVPADNSSGDYTRDEDFFRQNFEPFP